MTKSEHDKLCRELADRGKIIEAGFLSLQFITIPPDASPIQISEMRKAFFAGAQHLWDSIMGLLEAGSEPTENDLRRMSTINSELEDFVNQLKVQHTSTSGNA